MNWQFNDVASAASTDDVTARPNRRIRLMIRPMPTQRSRLGAQLRSSGRLLAVFASAVYSNRISQMAG
jgi:hypothetical protein